MQVSGGIQWVMVVNLIIWTGLFLYLRRLDAKLRELESSPSIPLESAATTATSTATATSSTAFRTTTTGEETIR